MRSISSFRLAVGPDFDAQSVRGYYIDLREKAVEPAWPPPWFPFPGYHRYIAAGQWALAALERANAGEPGPWLDAAVQAGEHLLETQQAGGPRDGAWAEPEPYPHTFVMRGPWLSAMAQGHCASALVRLHLLTGREDFAAAAARALRPMRMPTAEGGAMALLDGRPFPEEYPTRTPSYVLNGGIYALWGVYDVWRGLGDAQAGEQFRDTADLLAGSLWRWDLGHWSRYDLYRHPLGRVNVASLSYHLLHVSQLRALDRLAPDPAFAAAAARFEAYAHRRANRLRALAGKVAFRLVVPRRHAVAARLPWSHPPEVPWTAER